MKKVMHAVCQCLLGMMFNFVQLQLAPAAETIIGS